MLLPHYNIVRAFRSGFLGKLFNFHLSFWFVCRYNLLKISNGAASFDAFPRGADRCLHHLLCMRENNFMTEAKNVSSPDDSTKKSVPRRPPEVDQYVDRFLSIVCDTSRRYILELLAIPQEGDSPALPERRSGDIAREIGLSAATTSEHLRQLTEIGLVASRREGNIVYYRLRNHALVNAFQQLIVALDKDYAAQLHLDEQ